MITTQITDAVFALPEQDRIELARRIIEGISADQQLRTSISQGVKRMEDIITGRVQGVSEEDFIRAIG